MGKLSAHRGEFLLKTFGHVFTAKMKFGWVEMSVRPKAFQALCLKIS